MSYSIEVARPGRVRRIASWLLVVLAGVVVAGVATQVYLIGAYVFGAGAGALDAHRNVGWAVHMVELLLCVCALVARPTRADVVLAVALAVVGTAQVALASGSAWVGALHPLLALFVLVAAGALLWRGVGGRLITPLPLAVDQARGGRRESAAPRARAQ